MDTKVSRLGRLLAQVDSSLWSIIVFVVFCILRLVSCCCCLRERVVLTVCRIPAYVVLRPSTSVRKLTVLGVLCI